MRYFKLSEFDCKETGENAMCPVFLTAIDELRHRCGFPFVITSGYRSPSHSIEAAKVKPGTHSQGIAADITYSNSAQAFEIVRHAIDLGFTGIGVAKTFIHVDMRRKTAPVLWLY